MSETSTILNADNKEVFLGDIDIIPRLKPHRINEIYAPVGSGKTTLVKTNLVNSVNDKREILVLIDTAAGRDQMINDEGENFTFYSDKWDRLMNGIIEKGGTWGSWAEFPPNQVPVMTFNKMAHLIKANPNFGVGWLKYIVLDECHNLKIYQSFSKDNTLKLLENWIKRVYTQTDIIIMALSATPRKIAWMFPQDKRIDILTQEEKLSLRTLKTDRTINYTSMRNLLPHLPEGRGVIYTSHIQKMLEFHEILTQHDKRNVEMIWSRNNDRYTLSSRQHEIWNSILNQSKIPDETDILMFNASCQTGVNINTLVDFMVADEWDEDTITQARGRIRNDLPLLFLPSKNPDYFYLPSDLLGIRIYQDDKPKIIDYVNRRNDGHLKRWNTVSSMIRSSDTYCFGVNERTGHDYFRDYNYNGKEARYHIVQLQD